MDYVTRIYIQHIENLQDYINQVILEKPQLKNIVPTFKYCKNKLPYIGFGPKVSDPYLEIIWKNK